LELLTTTCRDFVDLEKSTDIKLVIHWYIDKSSLASFLANREDKQKMRQQRLSDVRKSEYQLNSKKEHLLSAVTRSEEPLRDVFLIDL